MTIGLTAKKRTASGKAVATLREKGVIPAVVYGPKQEALSIELSQREFSKVLEDAGESTVIELSVDGESHNVLIHEVDHDPVTGMARHADFYEIVKGQKVEVAIQLSFVGESAAVKGGANLVKTLHEVEVEADPMNLPHELEVDIAALAEVGSQILASDIKLPPGVTLITGADEVVAIAAAAKEEEELPVGAPDLASIELSEERGKKPEEEGSEEASV